VTLLGDADGRYDFDMPTFRYTEFDRLEDLLKNMGKEILRRLMDPPRRSSNA